MAEATAVAEAAFRALMASHPGGVAVITTADERGTPYGFTCTALCSVSLDPPRLLVCASHSGRTLPVLAERGAFVVNLLHAGGRGAAEAFTSRTADRFAEVSWRPGPATGLPVLSEAAHAVAECRVAALHPCGDHTIVVGDVLRSEVRATAPAPLLYGRRRFAAWPSEPGPADA
ncbi:flavin reductase family protein [Streptomyces sp. URMC 126]|uniref:flavin reductase family protein n=1 Tax=Streptomyces sp. URMC 126 TaxID=3423401 RepID=UPI003F1B539D